MVKELKKCRVCNSADLTDVIDLGNIFPSGFVEKNYNRDDHMRAPLVLCRCESCGLVQLKHTVELDLMYRQYWYSSSLNKSMVSALKDVVLDIESRIDITSEDTVVDIGCNDGTMLSMYSSPCIKVGFDPAFNLKKPEGVYFYNDYFTSNGYFDVYGHTKAKAVTAIAMFYDLPDPVGFVKEVESILDDNGIFVVQFTDLLSMVKANAFDNICHEHLEYYTLQDVVNILNEANMQIVDVSYNMVNGGSVRVFAKKRTAHMPTDGRVVEALVDESNYLTPEKMAEFVNNIGITKFKVNSFLRWCKGHDKVTAILGASTKGNTLLQVCGVNNTLVDYAAEVNKDKFGLVTLGSDIDITSEEDALIRHPDFMLVPVWHFKASILNGESNVVKYIKSGGTLVFPLPYFHVITYNRATDQLVETRL